MSNLRDDLLGWARLNCWIAQAEKDVQKAENNVIYMRTNYPWLLPREESVLKRRRTVLARLEQRKERLVKVLRLRVRQLISQAQS